MTGPFWYTPAMKRGDAQHIRKQHTLDEIHWELISKISGNCYSGIIFQELGDS